ncbi:LBF_4227 family protein [Leptospira licerasiae]|uniref:LBF_4227 family protein n=1 Tax=Leptospira licerasiae TaxID=447106 RepID=UPI003015C6DF
MAAKKTDSEEIPYENTEKQDGTSFSGFELKEHLLAFINSIAEYFETLLLYAKRIATEKIVLGIQAYIFFRIALFFISLSALFFLAAFFLLLQRQFGGDPLPAALGTGGLCLFISLLGIFTLIRKLKA